MLAGLEVLETVITAGIEPEHPLAVAFFTDEEGSRFAPDMLGSLVFAGGMPLEDALGTVGVDGAVLGDELDRIGYAGIEPCPARPPHAYVELHIEQGPVLEAEGITIGAVTGVQGISWTELTITGQSNHAGTTPMDMRRDAGTTPAPRRDVRARARRGARSAAGRDRRADRAAPEPRQRRRGAGHDDRRPAQHRRRRAREAEAEPARVPRRAGRGERREDRATLARPLRARRVRSRRGRAGRARGSRPRAHGAALPSGAGHDAQMLARVCPAGMVFVPSARGISHNPAEHTDDADLEAGANVLLQCLLELAGVKDAP